MCLLKNMFVFFIFFLLIDTPGGASSYVSAPALVQQISALQSDLLSLQFELESSLPEDRRRCINDL